MAWQALISVSLEDMTACSVYEVSMEFENSVLIIDNPQVILRQ
jgi:hypothetical protein